MGYCACPGSRNHPHIHQNEVRCCWRCDRCPKEHNFRLQRGDYCPDCVKWFKENGYVWSERLQNYKKAQDSMFGESESQGKEEGEKRFIQESLF